MGEHRADTFFYAKGGWSGDRVRIGGIAAGIRKLQQVFLQKSDLLAAVRVGQGWVGVMLDTDGFRKYKINYSRLGSYFDSLRAVGLLDLASLRLGLLVLPPSPSTSTALRTAPVAKSKQQSSTVEREDCGRGRYG